MGNTILEIQSQSTDETLLKDYLAKHAQEVNRDPKRFKFFQIKEEVSSEFKVNELKYKDLEPLKVTELILCEILNLSYSNQG